MLPKPGQKTVTVSGKALTLLEQRYRIEKTKKPNLSFAAFISGNKLVNSFLVSAHHFLPQSGWVSYWINGE